MKHRRKTSRKRRRSNPSMRGLSSSITPTVKSGFTGALGGLGLDLLWGKTSSMLPASIASSALAQYAVKLLGAVLVGTVGNYALKGKGRDLAVGAATIVLHDALKSTLQTQAPATFGPGGTLGLGLYLNGGMGILPRGSGGDIVQNGIQSLNFPRGSGQDLIAEGNSGATRGSGIDLVSGGIAGFGEYMPFGSGAGESDIG